MIFLIGKITVLVTMISIVLFLTIFGIYYLGFLIEILLDKLFTNTCFEKLPYILSTIFWILLLIGFYALCN